MTFKKGNKHGVGNPGPSRPNFLTQALISQLHEIDVTTGKEKLHLLAETLIKLALGGLITVYKREKKAGGREGKKRKAVLVPVKPDLYAIREILDRVQGKAVTQVGFDAGTGKVSLIFEPEDESA